MSGDDDICSQNPVSQTHEHTTTQQGMYYASGGGLQMERENIESLGAEDFSVHDRVFRAINVRVRGTAMASIFIHHTASEVALNTPMEKDVRLVVKQHEGPFHAS
jgi:hypothetical protein